METSLEDITATNVEINLLDKKTPDTLLKEYTELEILNRSIEQKVEEFKEEHKEIFNELNKMLADIVDNANKQNEIKTELTTSMKQSDIDSISNKMFKVKYIAETIRHDFDKDKFKKENEELYSKYFKDTKVKDYIKITEVK